MALTVILMSISGASFKVEGAVALETIYIRADGGVYPPSAPILPIGDLYFVTNNITTDGIVIERDNMTLDGSGYSVQGVEGFAHEGIYLSGRHNVTIKNISVKAFLYGIWLDSSSSNSLSKNIIEANEGSGIVLSARCQHNDIVENEIIGNNVEGIFLLESSYQRIVLNNITANTCGISLYHSSNNNIYGNLIANNTDGIHLHESSNNLIYHNSFVNNVNQVYTVESMNVWDQGYPLGGNYWSDYAGFDLHSGLGQNLTGSDGIGDIAYVIDMNNTDRYPLMTKYVIPEFPSLLILPLLMVVTVTTCVVRVRTRARMKASQVFIRLHP